MDKEGSSQSQLHKRQRLFSQISKINPVMLKSVITSGSAAASTPKGERVLPVYSPSPMSRSAFENAPETVPLTIFYNGTVTVFYVSREKAETIMKFAEEESNFSLQLGQDGVMKSKGFDLESLLV